jgi:uncharacterized protein YegL
MSEFWTPEATRDDTTFDPIRFAAGAQKRASLLFLLDTSGSMNGPEGTNAPNRPIDELNEAMKKWAAHLNASYDLRYRAELAVISFGAGGVRVHEADDGTTFSPAATFVPPELYAGGITPMFEAIRTAIDLSERRKAELDELGIQRARPLIFMVTDAVATDDSGYQVLTDEVETMASQIAALEQKRKLAFFAVGVTTADQDLLATLAPNAHWHLAHGDIAAFLIEASNSAAEEDPIDAAKRRIQGLGKQV